MTSEVAISLAGLKASIELGSAEISKSFLLSTLLGVVQMGLDELDVDC